MNNIVMLFILVSLILCNNVYSKNNSINGTVFKKANNKELANKGKIDIELGVFWGVFYPRDGKFLPVDDRVKVTYDNGKVWGINSRIYIYKNFGTSLGLKFFSSDGVLNTTYDIEREKNIKSRIISIPISCFYRIETASLLGLSVGCGPGIYIINEEVNIQLSRCYNYRTYYYDIIKSTDEISIGGHIFIEFSISVKDYIDLFTNIEYSISPIKEVDIGGFTVKFGVRL